MLLQIDAGQTGIIRQIISLERDVFAEGGLNEWHLLPLIRHGRVYAWMSGENVLGAAQYMRDWLEPTKAYLIGISIQTGSRGQGLGTLLLEKSLNLLSADGVRHVELTVDPDNKAAIRVYREKLGFTDEGTRQDEYGPGVHRLVMVKKLT